jgi:hypothetical protein
MKYTQTLLPFFRGSAIPRNNVSHFSLYVLEFKNPVQALIEKIDAIVDKEVQKIQVHALLLFFSYLSQENLEMLSATSWGSKKNCIG